MSSKRPNGRAAAGGAQSRAPSPHPCPSSAAADLRPKGRGVARPALSERPEGAAATLREIYRRLEAAYGSQHWWPGETPTEIVIGAILTQNTAWRNVERAIGNLRAAGMLDFAALRDLPQEKLAELVRPAGTFRIKAARLKGFVEHLWQRPGGSLESLLGGELEAARDELLSISGIGPETADAILLYAADRPTFVVDAYTIRILRRHFVVDGRPSYESVRQLFQDSLPPDAVMFNEYHALLVAVGKLHCRKAARCDGCPLASLPHDAHL